jgi:hypothetical protein
MDANELLEAAQRLGLISEQLLLELRARNDLAEMEECLSRTRQLVAESRELLARLEAEHK